MSPKRRRTRCAFVTFLMLNDSYLPGALMLAYALIKQGTRADRVCMVTPEISRAARYALCLFFDRVIDVDPVYVPHKRRQKRQDRPYMFTRLNALRLGRDGDLGTAYERLVLLDADVLPLCHYDRLFQVDAPAGILNEHKSHFVERDAQGKYAIPQSVYTEGTWRWHRLYGDVCPHGCRIPRYITDRVVQDPLNLGINGSLFVLEPDMSEFRRILDDVRRPEVCCLVGDRFDWPEMQYLTVRWSGRWTNVDLRFSGFNGYPGLPYLYGTHYAGFKPWSWRHKSLSRYARHGDFQFWFQEYVEMTTRAYPGLRKVKKLRALLEHIEGLGVPAKHIPPPKHTARQTAGRRAR